MQTLEYINYQYRVLRYRPDHTSEEFANVGIVMYSPKDKYIKTQFVKRYGRLSQFFGGISGTQLLRSLKALEKSFTTVSKRWEENDSVSEFDTVTALTDYVLHPNDTSLYFSDEKRGWDINYESAFADLYNRKIGKFLTEKRTVHTDNAVWKEVYKDWFDRYDITKKLKPEVVNTNLDKIKFERTYQNGALHCFQSLALDLVSQESVKDKVYRWAGRLDELETAGKELKIYLMSSLPDDTKLQELIDAKLNLREDNLKVEVIREEEAEAFSRRIQQDIERFELEH